MFKWYKKIFLLLLISVLLIDFAYIWSKIVFRLFSMTGSAIYGQNGELTKQENDILWFDDFFDAKMIEFWKLIKEKDNKICLTLCSVRKLSNFVYIVTIASKMIVFDDTQRYLWSKLRTKQTRKRCIVIWRLFKLADRMRSMRTNGASKNRDSWFFFFFGFPSKLLSIQISYFGT